MVPTLHSFTTLWVATVLISFCEIVRTQTIPECSSNLGLYAPPLDPSPCQVLVSAMTTCARRGDLNVPEYTIQDITTQSLGQYPVPVLDSTSPFTQCECTDVSYNLHQACAACQNGPNSNVTARSIWFHGCKGVGFESLFQGVTLDLWMTQVYEPAFDVAKAQQVDQTGTPLPQGPTTSTVVPVGATPASSSGDDNKKSSTPVIIGAVVGGVVFLLLVGGLLCFFIRKRNARKRVAPSAEFMKYAHERNMSSGPGIGGGTTTSTSIPLTHPYPARDTDSSRYNPRGSVIRLDSGGSEMDRLDPEGIVGTSRVGGGDEEATPAYTPGLFKDPVFEKGVALNLAASASVPSGINHVPGGGGGAAAFGYGGTGSPMTYSPATPSVSVNHSSELSRLIHGKRGST